MPSPPFQWGNFRPPLFLVLRLVLSSDLGRAPLRLSRLTAASITFDLGYHTGHHHPAQSSVLLMGSLVWWDLDCWLGRLQIPS